ncbi:HTTM domain-containing protein [Tenacibaculum aestuariivivum]|uniref:HTTM domain-containing protein n=1 Tax=Tenacibaculum aestuariivivum TaxID=2006131 RepID=UPI003AB2CD38
MMVTKVITYLLKKTPILPLAIFRMAFGFLMCFSMFRFIYNGWIEDCYITPKFHFTYQFFDWIHPFNTTIMYTIVITCAIAALCIGFGFIYKVATILFFLTFTYLELIEKSWYLNHYYFVSLVAFLLILVPANKNYSIDSKLFTNKKLLYVPNWTINIFKLQLAVVYFFGGIAKLKADWLFNAQPLSIWLKAKTNIPFIGWLFEYNSMPYIFSWYGMLYDIIIPFLLWIKKTRPIAYFLVVIFHVLTHILFNIGMFPWIMIFGSLVFITQQEWRNIFKLLKLKATKNTTYQTYKTQKITLPFLLIFFSFQILFPLRHYLLTDNVLWTENGFRFSWNVMLMEKNGYTAFKITDKNSGKKWIEYPSKNLSIIQENQMSFQPDMIWQYAHFLKEEYLKKGYPNIQIYVNVKVSLNGRNSQTLINPTKNLLEIKTMDAVYKHVTKLY